MKKCSIQRTWSWNLILDYYCDTCFDVGKCEALAVEKPHYHYGIQNRQGEERHLYQVKVNAPIARDTKDHIHEACVIAAVVVFHECDPDKLIFISIHFCYGFLPSAGKECKNPQPLSLLPDHTDLFIEDKLGHFILQKIYNAASKPPAMLQMHTKCFWSECDKCNKWGGGHQFESNPHQQYPLHSPNTTPVGVLDECPL